MAEDMQKEKRVKIAESVSASAPKREKPKDPEQK